MMRIYALNSTYRRNIIHILYQYLLHSIKMGQVHKEQQQQQKRVIEATPTPAASNYRFSIDKSVNTKCTGPSLLTVQLALLHPHVMQLTYHVTYEFLSV